VSAPDAGKAGLVLLFAALLQVTIVASVEVANGRPDVVLVLLVAIALLRGPLLGAVAGFWAGLVIDFAALQTLGLSSLLLTVAGYWSGRFGEVTSKSSPHPPLIAVALATTVVALGSAILHFMLGESVPASELFARVLLPTLALNLLLAYPLYRLCRRLFGVRERERREATLVV
jgi:rod shape-determining protein MreD